MQGIGGIITHQELLSQLLTLAERIALIEGRTPTVIPFLSIIKSSRETPLSSGVLTPSFCLILQGAKLICVGDEIYRYAAGDYLAAMIDMPASGQVTGASKDRPYIGLRIDIQQHEMAAVAREAEIKDEPSKRMKLSTGAFVGKSNEELLLLFIRLLKLTSKPEEARYVSKLIKQEIIYYLLSGELGHLFFQKVLFDQGAEDIGMAIHWIKENYTRAFTVKELAATCRMSTSSLHHKFKAITAMGPLKYQKQLRLQAARHLMLNNSMSVTSAALEVGYESTSQFNREYRRYFGLPPFQDIKALRKETYPVGFEDS